MLDLLWSDPSEDKTQNVFKASERGVGYTFGAPIIDKFCEKHDLDMICRAHQVVESGFEFYNNRRLVTIFSAPNYCGEFDNDGAVM